MFRQLYLSRLGYWISLVLRSLAVFNRPFMVYGYVNRVTGRFCKFTRVASNAVISSPTTIDMGDNVWVGYFCLLDGIGGIQIGDGVHIASHTSIYSHSSENAIRLLGSEYIVIPAEKREGYVLKSVKIGRYCFIGTGATLLPGVELGAGCIVGAGSVLKGSYPDHSIVVGSPAKVVGDVRHADRKLLESGLSFTHYYDPELRERLSTEVAIAANNAVSEA